MAARDDPNNWTPERVAEFVKTELKLSDVAKILLDNDMDGSLLLKVTDKELKEDLEIASFGKRKKLLDAVKRLEEDFPQSGRLESAGSRVHTAASTIERPTKTIEENPRDAFDSGSHSRFRPSSGDISTNSVDTSVRLRRDFIDSSDYSTDSLSACKTPLSIRRSHEPSEIGPSGASTLPMRTGSSNKLSVTANSRMSPFDDPSTSELMTASLERDLDLRTAPFVLAIADDIAATRSTKTDDDVAYHTEDAVTALSTRHELSSRLSAMKHDPPMTETFPLDGDVFPSLGTDETSVTKSEEVAIASIAEDLAQLVSIKQTLRPYQKELVDKINMAEANGHNAVVCAPTGSGKTLVAASHCSDVIRIAQTAASDGERHKCIYFVVPTVHLVEQQGNYIRENIINCTVGQISGDQTDTTLCEQTATNDVVVMTPAILVNALKEKDPQVKLSDISLLVLDECHHTDKEHPYMHVMNFYLKQKFEATGSKDSLPRVLGMTATLGMGSVSSPKDAIDHVKTLCANLDASELVTVTEHCRELYQYVAHPDTELKSVSKRMIKDPFYQRAAKMMTEIQRKSHLLEKPYEHGTQEYETVINQHRVALEMAGDHEALFYVNVLICYNRALQVYQDMRKEEALDFLFRKFSEVATEAEGNSKLVKMIRNERENNVDRLQELQEVHSFPNPKLEALKCLLLDEFKRCNKAKGIIFMKTREFTSALVKWCNQDSELSQFFTPSRLVGGGSETRGQMTKAEQLQAIRSFDEGDCNLLVATTIGEEGLDIPECNFVIRYETVTSEIGEVQARGRARVRVRSSRFVEIVTLGSANEAHAKANKYRQKLMTEASNAVRCLPQAELLNEMQKRQMERLHKLDKQTQRLQAKRLGVRASIVQLKCKQCGIDVCKGSDVLVVDNFYVVAGGSVDAKINVKESPNPKIGRVGKIYCKNCSRDWGIMKQFANGIIVPSLKCESFLFCISRKPTVIKKWMNVPFEVQKGSEDDL